MSLYMVFDVESVGLHGEGFAVGFVVVDRAGAELASGRFACDRTDLGGTDAGRDWVAANVPLLPVTHGRPCEMRSAFWAVWLEWKARGALLAADCAWPVEANFLSAAVRDVRPVARGGFNWADSPREWEGPYPLLDLAGVRLAAGFDPLGTAERLPGELPVHDPMADARQSARLLLEALAKLRQ